MAASLRQPVLPAGSVRITRPDRSLSNPVFWIGFVLFLVIALVAEMLTIQWRAWLPGAEGDRSLIGGVTSAVYTFMSYIP
jgi:light-harvesting complex 1 beta chain